MLFHYWNNGTYMEAQTYLLLSSLGSSEGLDLILALLEEPGGVRELEERTGVPKATASVRLKELASAGLVFRTRPKARYEVALPDQTRAFLDAASAFAQEILDERKASEQKLQRRVRKSRFRAEGGEQPATG